MFFIGLEVIAREIGARHAGALCSKVWAQSSNVLIFKASSYYVARRILQPLACSLIRTKTGVLIEALSSIVKDFIGEKTLLLEQFF